MVSIFYWDQTDVESPRSMLDGLLIP